MTLEEIVDAAPDIILVSPCGYGAQQAQNEYLSMPHTNEWNAMPAVRSGRVFALEANSYFSRPGPRLITGIEALASVFHPGMRVEKKLSERPRVWLPRR